VVMAKGMIGKLTENGRGFGPVVSQTEYWMN
jgi:hypothetical protein